MNKLDRLIRIALLAGLAVVGAEACGQSSNGGSSTGGSLGSGGTAATTLGTGGGQAAGGAVSGGSGGNGGVAGSGGVKSTGGSQGSGGSTAIASGGTGAGGVVGAGGSSTVGGSTGNGGASGGVAGAGGGAGGGTTGGTGSGGAGGSSGSATCPAVLVKPTDGKKTLLVGTTSRSYYLHIPAKYDGTKPAPLVVDFHGLGGDGTSEAGSNPYKPVIDPEGVVSAYPDGANGTNGTGWNLGTGLCCTSVDDVAFAKALVQDVAKAACIDLKRVYAVGYSLGGGMVHVLACNAADVFAAVSPAASDLVKETVDSCKPVRPITEITFRGTADPAVPYGGGSMGSFTNIGAVATFQKWAEIDQCTGSPSAADSNGCSTYSACAAGVQVTLCTKQGGGHDPGNATVSWPVLKKYTLP